MVEVIGNLRVHVLVYGSSNSVVSVVSIGGQITTFYDETFVTSDVVTFIGGYISHYDYFEGMMIGK